MQFQPALPLADIAGGLLIAAVLGCAIGLEREFRHKSAGLRTHMTAAVAAATFALLTREFMAVHADTMGWGGSPYALIKAVAEGAAVLSAATIIAIKDKVRGLTTGVGLWLTAAIGLASGLGSYVLAGLATILALTIIGLLGRLESALEARARTDDNE